jgi:hypothetical protein
MSKPSHKEILFLIFEIRKIEKEIEEREIKLSKKKCELALIKAES